MNAQVPVQQPPRAVTPKVEYTPEYHVFRNSLGNAKYTFPWGKDANFLGGEYPTNIVAEIAHFVEELAVGHPHLTFTGTREEQFTDPLAEVKRKAVADYLVQQERALDATKVLGSTDQGNGKLSGIATTANINAAASGSSSGQGAGAVVLGGVSGAKGIGASIVSGALGK